MKIAQAIAIGTIVVSICIAGCKKDESRGGKNIQALPPIAVRTAKVEKRIADNQVEVVGTVQAVEQAEISAKVTGNIVTLPVQIGTRVKAGELLVELSAADIAGQVQQAKAQLEQAKRNLQREENLLKRNAATPETVKTMEDSLKIADAAYRTSLTTLDFTKIVAPFSGIITRKLVNIGDLATPGKPLLHIEEENKLQVLTDIPEAMITKIAKGDVLKIFVPSCNLHIDGTVSEVSPIAEPSSRTMPIKLRIGSDPQLRSGQFARVTLKLATAEALTVPLEAVTPYGQMERVYTIHEGKARLRLVKTGANAKNYIEIQSGLSEGETVILAGGKNIEDNQPVTIQQ